MREREGERARERESDMNFELNILLIKCVINTLTKRVVNEPDYYVYTCKRISSRGYLESMDYE